ncbi:glycosyltransferase family 2 protein [Urechidicola vernalis]|uniref:Glycosyltransferase family 2 protein n=1 Tax=Urechidicola vernalis TaxID=3075600 RepID=A0ABU2Y387_9FLAO|nr:glycosyltransferase family 2 protein [Urechidicola sp. P050]MDT0552281.1 glycosyltransferase family 2 protein [Urechidicola sp. P050]
MSKPLISVIIPTFNRAHVIRTTLDSVIAQSYENWECLVVDDGSSDETIEVLKEYHQIDERIKVYFRPSDRQKGANSCRNFGFEKSNGEYINWLDSDDLWHPNMLQFHLNLMKGNEGKITVTQSSFFYNEKELNKGRLWKENKKENLSMVGMIRFDIGWQTTSCLWLRELLPSKPFDEDLLAAQEWLFHCKQVYSLGIESFIFSNKVLSFIRRSDTSSISNTLVVKKRNPNYLRARNKLLKFFLDSGDSENIQIVLNSLSSLLLKILSHNASNQDLIEFENLLKKINSRKWFFYKLSKRCIIKFKLNTNFSKRLLLRVLKRV